MVVVKWVESFYPKGFRQTYKYWKFPPVKFLFRETQLNKGQSRSIFKEFSNKTLFEQMKPLFWKYIGLASKTKLKFVPSPDNSKKTGSIGKNVNADTVDEETFFMLQTAFNTFNGKVNWKFFYKNFFDYHGWSYVYGFINGFGEKVSIGHFGSRKKFWLNILVHGYNWRVRRCSYSISGVVLNVIIQELLFKVSLSHF